MKLPLLLMGSALFAATIASAQVITTIEFTMNSAFEVGNTTLPSGRYDIRPTDDQDILAIQGQKGTPSVLFDVTELDSVSPFKQTDLIFNKYGNILVLKSIKVAGETIGVTTVMSELERNHFKTHGKPVKVTFTAKKKQP